MPTETTETSTSEEETLTTTTAETKGEVNKESTKKGSGSTKTDDNKSSDEGKTFSSDYVKDLRKESADYRQKYKDSQKKAEDAEKLANDLNDSLKSTQTESKKALEETKRLNSAIEKRFINAELKAAAMEEGLVDIDAFKMVDTSSIKINDNGEVAGVKDLLAALKKDKPYLFKEVNTSNKNSAAPPVNNTEKERIIYKDKKEFEDAKRKFLSKL